MQCLSRRDDLHIDLLLYRINEHLTGVGYTQAFIALPDNPKTSDFRGLKVVRAANTFLGME